MTIQIQLDDDKEQLLKREAERRGIEVSDYARQLIECQLPISNGGMSSKRTFPLSDLQQRQAQAFEASSMTQEELDDYAEDFVHRVVRGGQRQSDGPVTYPK